jgi:hypothetical protein
MALIPGFEHDIFISYVHDDNEPEITGADGWIDQFYQYLDRKLKKHDKNISIWWDVKNLRKAERFDKSIQEAVEKSAIMLCLYSRRYTKSDYCIKEMDMFHTKASKEPTGLDVGNFPRIIPVMMSNISFEDWPEQLTGTTSFSFHDGIAETDYGDPLKITTEKFEKQMVELRNDLVNIIEGFINVNKKRDSVGKPKVEIVNEDSFTLFFSEINDAMYDRREGVIADLKKSGYKVIIGDESSAQTAEHQKITTEQVTEANLIINILGDIPGRKIKDDPDNRYILKQVEIGLASDTPQLIWLSSDVKTEDVKDELHREFLLGIEDHSVSDKDYDFVQGNEGNLAKLIKDHIKHLKQKQLHEQFQENKTDVKDDLTVLLETHVDDFQQGFKLKKALAKNDVDLIFNQEDGDPQENIKSLYKNIGEAEKFIFLYGNDENQDWVDVRVKKTLQKLTEFDRFGQDIYVYMAPPFKDSDTFKLGKHPLIKVLNYSDSKEPDDQLISDFLNEIKGKES